MPPRSSPGWIDVVDVVTQTFVDAVSLGSDAATVDLLRNLTLAVPLVAVLAAGAVRSRRRDLAARVPAAVLSTLLAWVGILAVETAGGWWQFAPGPTTVLGMPLETSAGWALAWGALPVLVGGPPAWWWLAFVWTDLLLVPALDPLVTLGPGWLAGEAVLLVCVAAPALAMGRLTARRRLLGVRVALQVATFTGLFGWAATTLAFQQDGLGWADVVDHSFGVRALLLAAAVVVAVPVMSAVTELARVGGGTPFPWDPPARLVMTGPYAYIRNPMQAGACLLLTLLGVAAGSPTLLLGVLVAATFSLAVADPHERRMLVARWPDPPVAARESDGRQTPPGQVGGPGREGCRDYPNPSYPSPSYPNSSRSPDPVAALGYAGYRRAVRAWIPRWRPVAAVPATLWVSQTCALCRSTGEAVRLLGTSGLELRPAESSPVRLTRMRWSAPGVHDRGVAALGRALEHASLPWAWCGWLVRLPVVTTLLQLVADACGLGPRDLAVATRTVAQ
ncbi:MAG: methyltransferase family protein [Dermatophilaceae bacterium]